jgi:hypothetical protein
MRSLWSSALTTFTPAILASRVFVETAAPSSPARERIPGWQSLI